MDTPFDLDHVYVQLFDGADAVPVEVDPESWQQIGHRPALHAGRLVSVFAYSEDWKGWEMHPAAGAA